MTSSKAWAVFAPWIVISCGSDGVQATAASASGTSTGATPESESASPTEGPNSLSDSASASTDVSGSISDSQASMTVPTTSAGSMSASDSSTGTTGASTDAPMSTGTGTTMITETGTGGTTVSIDTTSTSTTGAPPECSDPPAGFEGPSDPACVNELQVGAFNPVAEWSKSTWSVGPAFTQVMAAPIVVSLTDDNNDGNIDDLDVPDIVFTSFAANGYGAPGWLRAISGKDGAEIFNVGNQSINGAAGVAGGDIDNDGIVEIVTVTSGGLARAFEHDGTLKWTSPAIGASPYSAPAIADMDADGKPEIVVGKSILNNDGTLRATVKYGFGVIASVIADMDGDGQQELIGGNAIYDADGKEKWYNEFPDGWVGVADIDEDAAPDIVVVNMGHIRLQDGQGNFQWTVLIPGGGGGPPTIADIDGDGHPEIGVAGKAAYVVFEANGTVLWQKTTQDATSQQTGSSVYDFEGDGAADVVYNDEVRLRVYAGNNGAEKLDIAGHGSGTLYEYPLVVDVDNDGQSEIVVINNNYLYGTRTGVTVYGDKNSAWRPARKIWNQHAHSITNVIGRV